MNPDRIFINRLDAGRQLAAKLGSMDLEHPVVLGLPRGGVPVAFKIAQSLRVSLGTISVRKIGAPENPEFGVGAVAPDVLHIDEDALRSLGIAREALEPVIERETEELRRRERLYQSFDGVVPSSFETVIVVDDGLATGVTAQAAAESIKKRWKPKRMIFAAPLCARDSAERLRTIFDEVVCLREVEDLGAVQMWYQYFPEVSDDEVLEALQKANLIGGQQNIAA